MLPTVAVGVADVLVQSVDTADYPHVSFMLLLPPELAKGGVETEFTLRENDVEIGDLEARRLTEERDPIDVVLVFDSSGSMDGAPMRDAQKAAEGFISAMGREDRTAVIAFSSEPKVMTDFTSDHTQLKSAISALEASGETALYDGLAKAAEVVAKSETSERYIIVLSDGGDTVSINSLASATDAVVGTGVPIYAVALESPEYNPEPLEALVTRSMGRMSSASDSSALNEIYADIAEEMQNQWVLIYTSEQPDTRDLELAVEISNGEEQATVSYVTPNPLFDEWVAPEGLDEQKMSSMSAVVFWVLSVALVFVAIALFVVAVGGALTRDSTAKDQLELYEQFTAGSDEQLSSVQQGSMRSRVMLAVGAVAEKRGFTGVMSQKLEQAGLPLRSNEYMYFHLLGTILFGVIARIASGSTLVAMTVVIAAVFLPILWLEQKIKTRRKNFEEQLPDVLSLMAGSLRAGWGIQQAIDLVVQEIAEPAASEFQRVQSQARLGLPLEEALDRMAERLDSADFHWTVAAIAIQREVGGNLAEVLDIVTNTIRERAELRRHVRSLTAESRFSAIVLFILPFFIMIALFIINPGYMSVMVSTALGLGMLLFGGVLLLIGLFWLNSYSRIDV